MLKSFFQKYGWMYIPGVAFLFVSAWLQNQAPRLLGEVVDLLSGTDFAPGAVYRLIGLMLLVGAGVFVTRYIWRYFINGNARNLEAHARQTLFTHLQRMGMHFYAYQKTGDLMAYAINDINAIRMTLGPAFAMTFSGIAMTGLSISSMIGDIHPRLAAFALLPIPVIAVTMVLMGRQVRLRFRKVQEAFAAISDRVQENIAGLRVIKAYVQEDAEAEHFEQLNQSSRDSNLAMVRVSASMTPTVDLFFGISFTISLIYGSALVRDGVMTVGDFVAFNGYLSLIVMPVRSIARIINVLSRGVASLRRYNAILAVPPLIEDGPDDAPEGLNHADVQVEGLSFQYPGDARYALRDVSFHLKPGKTLGILGKTGAGKTTLANLLVRLYNVPDGTIRMGGCDSNRFSLDRLCEPIGYVPQDNFLFSSSIENNVKFFRPAYTHPQVVEACRRAAVLQNIEAFPNGFDTMVGERGMSLSGGQKQRICIARALIKEPDVLILDDSLSAVDTQTELEILASVREQTARGGSAILIAHRISVVAACDEIIVLEHGRVAERGTHEELLRLGGQYAAIAQEQMLVEEVEG